MSYTGFQCTDNHGLKMKTLGDYAQFLNMNRRYPDMCLNRCSAEWVQGHHCFILVLNSQLVRL